MIKKWSIRYPAVGGEEERRAYVYLPTMYEADPDRRYPVLYMFDGQNVFFDEDATYGKSWGVADYLDYTDTPLIVAAVECNAGANNERLVEYSSKNTFCPSNIYSTGYRRSGSASYMVGR